MLSPMPSGGAAADLLALNNTCGQALLSLVCNGNACIANLLDAADRAPTVFATPDATSAPLLPDFVYFSQAQAFETNIDGNEELLQADATLRDTYMPMINKMFDALHGVHSYVSHLNKYIEDVEEGVYLQQSLETLFADSDGKQLLCEALYLYGVMLLLVDLRMPGLLRERLLVAYYRYSSKRSTVQAEIDEICALLRSTGFDAQAAVTKRPPNYPENYFNRIPLNETYVSMVIGRLRNDELYNQLRAFPLPEHKSTAFVSQAAMLYICLYFQPVILQSQTATMREIVDKYWPNCWTTSVYLGISVNLVDAWEPYKAAKLALANTLHEANLTEMASRHGADVHKQLAGLSQVLNEGVLTKQFVTQNVNKLLNSLRKANVTLRWMLMHYTLQPGAGSEGRKAAMTRHLVQTASAVKQEHIFTLMLYTAEFEHKMKTQLHSIVSSRATVCTSMRDDIVERLQELADVFSGVKPLTRVNKNERLQRWFVGVKTQMEALDFEPAALDSTARTLLQVANRMNEVGSLHSLDTHVGVRQFLHDLQTSIQQLLRTINIRDNVLWQVATIGDFAYAWLIVDLFTSRMQQGIQRSPELAIRLRSAFIKLASGLDTALLRIQQSNNEPLLAAISKFYSNQLVLYLRKVLQVIPSSVFSMLTQIVELQANRIAELPARLDRDKFKEAAKLDDRFKMAKLTHAISLQTEGLLSIKSTLVGIIRVQPRQVLEDGIRAELVTHACGTLHSACVFGGPSSGSRQAGHLQAAAEDLHSRLNMIASQMDAYRRSFAYISDYMNMAGLHMWQQEMHRVIAYNVEQECNKYRKVQITDEDSMYQSRLIPIPTFPPDTADPDACTFVGRLLNRIVFVADIRRAVYNATKYSWQDAKTQTDLLTPSTFELIAGALGAAGVQGVSKLAGFMLSASLEKLHRLLTSAQPQLQGVRNVLGQQHNPFLQPQKVYDGLLSKLGKSLLVYTDEVAKLGQLLLIRDQLCRTLRGQSQTQSRLLYAALDTFNQCLLDDLSQVVESDGSQLPEMTETLLYELGAYLDAFGITDATQKKYYAVPTAGDSHSADLLLLVTLSATQKLTAENTGLQRAKAQDAVDPAVLLAGVALVLQQYGTAQQYCGYVAHYVRSHLHHTYTQLVQLRTRMQLADKARLQATSKAPPTLPNRLLVVLAALRSVSRLTRTTVADELVPSALWNAYDNFV